MPDREKARERARQYYWENREEILARARERYRPLPPERKERNKALRMQRMYGIGSAEYAALLERQDGVCAICGRAGGGTSHRTDLCVDHCHETGLVRGLLCFPCNLGLGKLGDTLEAINKAQAYLQDHYSPTDRCPANDS